MNEVFIEDINEFYLSKEFKGNLQPPTVTAEATRSGTTDRVRIDLEIRDELIVIARYSGLGSVLSQGLAAYLCSRVEGMTVTEAFEFNVFRECQFDILPNRQECASLSVHALTRALDAYAEDQSEAGA